MNKKPKPSVFKTVEKAIRFCARLKKYHYQRAVQQVYTGKIKRIQDYKYFEEFLSSKF